MKQKFINKSVKKHSNRYDYSKVDYINSRTKVCIICPEHGEFWQEPAAHVRGYGCPKCSNHFVDTNKFIAKAKKIHGDKYDYSQVNYKKSKDKIKIICKEHGLFEIAPNDHLKGGGCVQCSNNNKRLGNKSFIEKAKEIYGEKYDYSKVEYINNKTKVCIIDPLNGEFWITPNNFLRGHSNKKKSTTKLTLDDFIRRSTSIHNGQYSYDKVEYINSRTKVCITCNKHGDFFQKPQNHLLGNGCPQCGNKWKLEEDIKVLCESNNINYEVQKNFTWLGQLRLDVYIPSLNIAIECQGEQHYRPIKYFGGEQTLIKTQERDKRKETLCRENGVKLIYYSNQEYPNTITNKEEILKILKK